MNKIASRIKPKSGFSHFIHIFFTALIPVLIYVFIRWGFIPLALVVILLSKWRMFAVRPRHWWPNVRANGVDIIVGISTLVFMVESTAATSQLIWAFTYGVWLVLIKPKSGALMMSVQAIIGQSAGLMALWLGWGNKPLGVLVFFSGLIAFISARHFFSNYEEPYAPLFSHTWGYFAASLSWILGHWLLFYGVVAQPPLLLTVIGFGLGGLYYLEQTDRLSKFLRRQILFIIMTIVTVVLLFSDWGSKTV